MSDQIRASALSSWSDCGRRNASKQFSDLIMQMGYDIRDEDLKPKIYSAFGTAVHRGAQTIHENIMDTGKRGYRDDFENSAMGEFEEITQNGVEYDISSNSKDHVYKQIQAIAKIYFNKVARSIKPIAVEKALSGWMHKKEIDPETQEEIITESILLKGHPDLVEEGCIRDLKTGRMNNFMGQMGGYALLAKGNGLTRPKKLLIDHIQRHANVKDITYEQHSYDVLLCEREAFEKVGQIRSQLKKFRETGNETVFPANPMSNMCSKEFCPAHETKFCKLTQKTRIK